MKPKKIILSDYSEYALWNITDKISAKINNGKILSILLDIRDEYAVEKTFNTNRPDIVLHAAALKHVPICENHPLDAIKTNILGTKVIAENAIKFKTKIMAIISTDKAVDPSSFMGASKRAAETLLL